MNIYFFKIHFSKFNSDNSKIQRHNYNLTFLCVDLFYPGPPSRYFCLEKKSQNKSIMLRTPARLHAYAEACACLPTLANLSRTHDATHASLPAHTHRRCCHLRTRRDAYQGPHNYCNCFDSVTILVTNAKFFLQHV